MSSGFQLAQRQATAYETFTRAATRSAVVRSVRCHRSVCDDGSWTRRRWAEDADTMTASLWLHDEIVRSSIERARDLGLVRLGDVPDEVTVFQIGSAELPPLRIAAAASTNLPAPVRRAV
jgi:hypothetical protein